MKMHRRDLTLCLALLAVQVSCALGRNHFYEYFYSLHHRSSSTANVTPSMPGSGSPAPDSSSVTTVATAVKDESQCCSTEIMLSNGYYDGRNDVMDSPFAWIIIMLYISLGIGCCGICVLICRCCCCPKGPKTVGYVVRGSNQPQPQQQQQQQQPAEVPVFHQEHQPTNPPPYEASLGQQGLPYPVQQYNHQYQYQLQQQPLVDVQNFQPPPTVAAAQNCQKY